MGTHRQRFLNQLAALGAFLRRQARIDSDHLTASTCSLATQDSQKRAPRGIKNALCQSTARQPSDIQVFDHDRLVRIDVLLRGLEVEVAALATLLASAQAALLAAQGRLAGPKEARVVNRLPITIG